MEKKDEEKTIRISEDTANIKTAELFDETPKAAKVVIEKGVTVGGKNAPDNHQ